MHVGQASWPCCPSPATGLILHSWRGPLLIKALPHDRQQSIVLTNVAAMLASSSVRPAASAAACRRPTAPCMLPVLCRLRQLPARPQQPLDGVAGSLRPAGPACSRLPSGLCSRSSGTPGLVCAGAQQGAGGYGWSFQGASNVLRTAACPGRPVRFTIPPPARPSASARNSRPRLACCSGGSGSG